jgi:peptidoglycan biosynthesis protein MviN/MurJ (putative lipid II flippase)
VTEDEDDRRIARGNPFARAVRPDDERATSPVMYVVVGLLSMVLFAVFVAALVLPPLFMHTLIIRGLRTGRVGMLLLGIAIAAIYLLLLWSVGKRLMSRPKPHE